MQTQMRNQLLCAWSGVVFTLLFMVGFWLVSHFVPPPSPSATATQIAEMYQGRTWQIRLGLFLMMASCGFACAFQALISTHMKRIEGGAPALTYTQLAAGAAGVPFLIVPTLFWTVAAFRPDRDPNLILLLNDLGWIMLLMPFTTFVIQNFALSFAILSDRGAPPVFPRWLGFFTLWVGVLFIPGGLLTFFKRGPFAWDGVFVFWIPLLIFFTWYLVMFTFLRRMALAQART